VRQRIGVLINYFLRTLFTSLPGSLYIIFTLAYWIIFFNPQQRTPEIGYFILIVGVFGPLTSFLLTLTISGQANQAFHYPFLVRLPSRAEYLTAVLTSALFASTTLQLLLSLLALIFGGPDMIFSNFIGIPPIWLALNIFATVLALHASDFVTQGWSRITIFGILAIFLFGQEIDNKSMIRVTNAISQYASTQGWYDISDTFTRWENNFSPDGNNLISQFFGFIFWPFRAVAEAIVAGHFTPLQALAPAIILLYAAILYLLAADLFSNKDLLFTE
jgi:hypothetical protein